MNFSKNCSETKKRRKGKKSHPLPPSLLRSQTVVLRRLLLNELSILTQRGKIDSRGLGEVLEVLVLGVMYPLGELHIGLEVWGV